MKLSAAQGCATPRRNVSRSIRPDDTLPTHHASEQLASRIQEAFAASSQSVLRTVHVRVHEGLVQLTGQVRSYYQKQVATAVVQQIEGVEELRNDLRVCRESTPHPHCQTSAATSFYRTDSEGSQ